MTDPEKLLKILDLVENISSEVKIEEEVNFLFSKALESLETENFNEYIKIVLIFLIKLMEEDILQKM